MSFRSFLYSKLSLSCLSAASCTQSSVCHVFPQLLVLNAQFVMSFRSFFVLKAQFVMSFRSFLYSKLSLSCLPAASCTKSSVCHVFPQLLVLKAQFVMSFRSFLYSKLRNDNSIDLDLETLVQSIAISILSSFKNTLAFWIAFKVRLAIWGLTAQPYIESFILSCA